METSKKSCSLTTAAVAAAVFFLILAVFGKSYAAGVLVHKTTNLADSMVNTIQEVPAPPMRFRQDYAD
jgi:archaellum component FlaG (FlaF/FlaG flagellin family)